MCVRRNTPVSTYCSGCVLFNDSQTNTTDGECYVAILEEGVSGI